MPSQTVDFTPRARVECILIRNGPTARTLAGRLNLSDAFGRRPYGSGHAAPLSPLPHVYG